MDITFNLLLITHLAALIVAAAGAVTMPIIAARMASATPEAKAQFGAVAGRLFINSRIAFGVLLISGIAMVYVRYGGVEGMSSWFWVKMGLVATVVAMMILGAVRPGLIPQAVSGWVTRLALIGIIVSAVFAFN